MKIIHFSRDYTTHDHRFLNKMVQTGHDIFFLRLEKSGQVFEERPLPRGVKDITWVGGQKQISWRDHAALVRDLKRIIQQYQPDIIQAGPVQRAAFLVALSGFKNLITMSWGYDLLIDIHRNQAWKWAAEYTLKHSAAFVGDCGTIRGLAEEYGMHPDRIVTFPWGADIRKFMPASTGAGSEIRQRTGWGTEAFVLLSTRSWSALYGVDDLAKAFVKAAQNFPELHLLMLGAGPLSEQIQQRINQAGLANRANFPGLVTQEDLPGYYQAADLYISTSHSDGTSISLLEALASGLPVLLADIPGNREWVAQPGDIGWLFRVGDSDHLAQMITRILQQRSGLAVMRQRARIRAEQDGDWEKNAQKLFEAWKIVQPDINLW